MKKIISYFSMNSFCDVSYIMKIGSIHYLEKIRRFVNVKPTF